MDIYDLAQEISNLYIDIAMDIKLSAKDEKKYAEIDKGKPPKLNYVERTKFPDLFPKIKKEEHKQRLKVLLYAFYKETEKSKFDFKIYEPFYPRDRLAKPVGWRDGKSVRDINLNMKYRHSTKLIYILLVLGLYGWSYTNEYKDEGEVFGFAVVVLFIISILYSDNKNHIYGYKCGLQSYLLDLNLYYGINKKKNYFSFNDYRLEEDKKVIFGDDFSLTDSKY